MGHPPTGYAEAYLSFDQNKDAYLFNQQAALAYEKAYQPDPHSPLFNILGADHTGFPPVYLQICGADPLRDDGLIYEHVLRSEYGIRTRLDIYHGMTHGFWAMFPELETSRKALQDLSRGVGWLLEQTSA